MFGRLMIPPASRNALGIARWYTSASLENAGTIAKLTAIKTSKAEMNCSDNLKGDKGEKKFEKNTLILSGHFFISLKELIPEKNRIPKTDQQVVVETRLENVRPVIRIEAITEPNAVEKIKDSVGL